MLTDSLLSEAFINVFPSKKSHHDRLETCFSQRGVSWTVFEKTTILDEILTRKVPISRSSSYLDVNTTRIYKMIHHHKDGKRFSSESHRSCLLDNFSKMKLIEIVKNGVATQHPLKVNAELKPLIVDLATETMLRRGGSGLNVTVSKDTFRRIIHDTKINLESGQTTTSARSREKSDFRNMVSMAAVNYAFAKDKSSHLIGNFDATQYVVSERNNELLTTIRNDKNDPLTLTENAGLDQAIKWFMLCNAAGIMGIDVFVIADSSMNEDEFKFYEVFGLSHSTMIGSKGYLYVSKTRCGNIQFFNWYMTTIVIPFTEQCRQYVLPAERNESFYLIADGEEVQIEPLESDNICNSMNEANIDFVKGPASCTGTIGNACDRCNIFKASKKVNKFKPTIPSDF
jgi:hypothetical protein